MFLNIYIVRFMRIYYVVKKVIFVYDKSVTDSFSCFVTLSFEPWKII